MADICIAYLSEDEPHVEQLVTLLRQHWDVWWAGDIVHGDWEEQVRTEIPKSSAFVPVLSKHAKGERKVIIKDEMRIEFNDWSVSEPINSERAQYIKQKISERINQSSVTVVYLSPNTPNSQWVKWEIEESMKRGKQVIGVHKGDTPPKSLPAPFKENGLKVVPWSQLADIVMKL